MSLTNDDVHRIGEIVGKAIAEDRLVHYRDCPQGTRIETLFRLAGDNAKAIVGVIEATARLTDSAAADVRTAQAGASGLRRGLMIGVGIGAAVATGSGGTMLLAKIIPNLF